MRRLKVAYFTSKHHPVDRFLGNIEARTILLGARNILRRALGPHDEEFCSLDDDEFLVGDTNVAVICGTAQIFSAAPPQILRRIAEIAKAPVPVKLNLGVGSFNFPKFGTDQAGTDRQLIERIVSSTEAGFYREYKGFNAIACRDQRAAHVLSDLDVVADLLPCPSFFSALMEPSPLIRNDRLVVSVLSGMSPLWDTVAVDVHGLYQSLWRADETRVFVSHNENEAAMLSALGIPFIDCPDEATFIHLLAQHDRLISFKGSDLAPAWSLGLNVAHIGLQRREQFGDDFGAGLRTISPWSEEVMQLSDGGCALSTDRPSEDFRRRWIGRHLNDYVALIRGAVRARIDYDFSSVQVGKHDPIDWLDTHRNSDFSPENSYFSGLSCSGQQMLPVPLERISSHHDVERSEDKLRIQTVTESRTLIFGPYIRLRRGPWRLKAKIILANSPENDLSIASEIRKGTLCLMISRQSLKFSHTATECELNFSHTFFNTSDTGFLEFVFVASEALPAGTVFEFTDMRLSRIDEPEEDSMKSLADNAAREMVHRLTEQLFEAGDYSEVMTLVPKITKLGLFAPTVSLAIKSALRLNTANTI